MKSQDLFSGKKIRKNIAKCCLLKFLPGVLSVKMLLPNLDKVNHISLIISPRKTMTVSPVTHLFVFLQIFVSGLMLTVIIKLCLHVPTDEDLNTSL